MSFPLTENTSKNRQVVDDQAIEHA